MKYQQGDIVLLLHSQEEGEVIDIINDKMVMVEVDKIRFPVYIDQIDFPYFKRFSEVKLFEKKKETRYVDDLKKEKATAKYKVSDGVWLSFLPVYDKDVFDDDIVESFKLYLINQTDQALKFDYKVNYNGRIDFELKNEIFPLTDFYLNDVLFEDMNDSPRFEFLFSLSTPDKKKMPEYESQVKLKAKQLFTKIEETLLKNEPTFSYNLFVTYPDKQRDNKPDIGNLYTPGYKIYDATKGRQNLEPPRSVVDLHIEKLSDNWKHLSNFEILTIQLKSFEKYYYLAVAHRQPNLIVIHGIGSGKLKNEIHEILKLKKEVKSFVNQFHPLFGYGATEIWLQY